MDRCDACDAEGRVLDRDHRIPKQFGGTDDPRNLHGLCRECHIEKSRLEMRRLRFEEDEARWFDLAFPHTDRSPLEYAEQWAASQ